MGLGLKQSNEQDEWALDPVYSFANGAKRTAKCVGIGFSRYEREIVGR
jgi:hypothetical protein